VVVTVINLLGIKSLSRVNTFLVVLLFVVVIYFVVASLHTAVAPGGPGIGVTAFINAQELNFSTLLAGTAVACFSFMGFDAMTTLAEEVKEPAKVLTKATVFVCLFMGLVFIVQAFCAQTMLPDFASLVPGDAQDGAFLNAAGAAGGNVLVTFMILAVVAGSLANAIDAQAGVSRVLYGMGRDHYIPNAVFAHLNKKTKVPTYTILICAVIGLIGSLVDLNTIVTMINFGALTAFMCVNLSVIFHYFIRKRQRTGFSAVKYLAIPGLGFVTCFALFISLSMTAKTAGVVWLVIGAIVLAIATKGFREQPKALDM